MPSRTAPLLIALLVWALAIALALEPDVSREARNDFVAYWAAGHLTLDGGNPYGAAEMFAVERGVGWERGEPLMLWNPPWMLSILMAFAALPFSAARAGWMVAQLALVLGCAVVLWRFYRGSARREPWAVLVAFAFAPLAASLKYGQIGPLCLLGLTGFLSLQAGRRDFLAGAALALASMKPHLVYAVWPAVVVWSVAAGRLRVLLGLALAGFALAALPAAVNPRVYADFFAMIREPPPPELAGLYIAGQDSPTFGWQLRLLVGKGRFDLQYLPSALGLVWLAWYGYRHRRQWDWAERLPVLLLVSVATAAYGAWPADSLLLLPAVVAVACRVAERGRFVSVICAVGAFATLTLMTHAIEHRPTTEAYVWIPPLYLAAYLALRCKGNEGSPGTAVPGL